MQIVKPCNAASGHTSLLAAALPAVAAALPAHAYVLCLSIKEKLYLDVWDICAGVHELQDASLCTWWQPYEWKTVCTCWPARERDSQQTYQNIVLQGRTSTCARQASDMKLLQQQKQVVLLLGIPYGGVHEFKHQHGVITQGMQLHTSHGHQHPHSNFGTTFILV